MDNGECPVSEHGEEESLVSEPEKVDPDLMDNDAANDDEDDDQLADTLSQEGYGEAETVEISSSPVLNRSSEVNGKNDSETESEYEVEKITGVRKNKGGQITHYKIRWKGYERNADTWETIESLNCDDLIQEFNNRPAKTVTKVKKEKKVKARSEQKKPKKNKTKVEAIRHSSRKVEKPKRISLVPQAKHSSRSNRGRSSKEITTPKQSSSVKRTASNSVIRSNKRAKLEPPPSEPTSDESDSEEYEVKEILEANYTRKGEWKFLVRWKGYGPDEDSWEPRENLNCTDLINDFITIVEQVHSKYQEKKVVQPKIPKIKTAINKKKKIGRPRR